MAVVARRKWEVRLVNDKLTIETCQGWKDGRPHPAVCSLPGQMAG